MATQKIIPHLWFDKEAKEAAHFYVSVFPNSKIKNESVLHDTPSGDCDVLSFQLSGYDFMSISAGPYFKLNPAISLLLNFDPSKMKDAKKQLDTIWKKLSAGGKILMPLQEYPFSKHYGWVEDKYGVSWQLMLTDPKGEERPFIIPFIMFTQDACGKAEEAMKYYASVFKNSKQGTIARYGANQKPDKEGTIMFCDFMLENQWFAAMDSAHKHEFVFNEAFSLIISCETQDEIDYYWKKLSHVKEAEQCGWLKDKFGVSWQINPSEMDEMLTKGTKEQVASVTKAFLQMKKFDLEKLRKAFKNP